jgi:hypothetical protein
MPKNGRGCQTRDDISLVETIHGADFYTIHQLTFDATLIDYIGHLSFLPDGRVSVTDSSDRVRWVRH